MAKTKEPINPFYILLVILGVLFFITACAYAVMLYRATQGVAAGAAGQGLLGFLDQFGMRVLAIELVALGIATFSAMWLDQFRSRP